MRNFDIKGGAEFYFGSALNFIRRIRTRKRGHENVTALKHREKLPILRT